MKKSALNWWSYGWLFDFSNNWELWLHTGIEFMIFENRSY